MLFVETLEPPVEHEENEEQLPLVAPPPGEAVRLVMAGARLLLPQQPRAAVASGQPQVPVGTASRKNHISVPKKPWK